jgi:hypothetical protein
MFRLATRMNKQLADIIADFAYNEPDNLLIKKNMEKEHCANH